MSSLVYALVLLVLVAAAPTLPTPSLCQNIGDECDLEACVTACTGCPDECTVRESFPPVYTCGSRSFSARDVCMFILPIAPSDEDTGPGVPIESVRDPSLTDPSRETRIATPVPEQCASTLDSCDKDACIKACSTCEGTCSVSESSPPQYTCVGSPNPPVSALDYCPDWPTLPDVRVTMLPSPSRPSPTGEIPADGEPVPEVSILPVFDDQKDGGVREDGQPTSPGIVTLRPKPSTEEDPHPQNGEKPTPTVVTLLPPDGRPTVENDPEVLPGVPFTTAFEQCSMSLDPCDWHACMKACYSCDGQCSKTGDRPPIYTCPSSSETITVSANSLCPGWPTPPVSPLPEFFLTASGQRLSSPFYKTTTVSPSPKEVVTPAPSPSPARADGNCPLPPRTDEPMPANGENTRSDPPAGGIPDDTSADGGGEVTTQHAPTSESPKEFALAQTNAEDKQENVVFVSGAHSSRAGGGGLLVVLSALAFVFL